MRRSLLFLLTAAVPLLLYARTVTFDYVYADDADLIAGNSAFLQDLSNLPRAFTRSYFEVDSEVTPLKTYYRPVAIVSFMLDARWGHADPRIYHATNVLLHAIATCLLVALALSWGAWSSHAVTASLIFAVHPVNVQTVAWIAGRNDLLMAVFGLMSLLAWCRLGSAPAARSLAIAVVHVVTVALAMFSKETGLFFPVLAWLHTRITERKAVSGTQRMVLVIDAAVVVVWALLRNRALAGMPSEIGVEAARAALANAPQLLVHAGKLLVPVRLNVSPGVDGWGIALGVFALLVFSYVFWRALPLGAAVLALIWGMAFLLPTLVVPGLPAYEHRTYLPLVGLLAVLSTGGAKRPLRNRRNRVIAGAAAAAIVAVFSWHAYQRQDVFRNGFSYWADATRDAQFGPMAHVNVGQLHEAAGRTGDARREYLRALERNPATPKAHNNLGVVLMQLAEPTLAVQHFQEEARLHPWNADAWFNLGLWAEMQGDRAEARRCYERAIAENPSFLPAYEKLGITRK